MSRLLNWSVIRQCKTAVLSILWTMGLACGSEGYAATAAASPPSRQLAMPARTAPAYSAIKLGFNQNGACMNASGQVAFNANLGGPAYFYNGTRFQNIGTLGGSFAYATGLNDYGQVVGVSDTGSRGSSVLFSTTPVRRMPGVSASNLNTCWQYYSPSTNSKDQLAGNPIAAGRTGDNGNHAFLWTPTKGMLDLGTFNGASLEPVGVNNAGQVIAFSNLGKSARGNFWSAMDGWIDLGGTSGPPAYPYAINNAGQVVGSASTTPDRSYAFLWTKAGGLVKLGGLGSYLGATATAINNKGQVVGTSFDSSNFFHAFSWTREDGMIDLGQTGAAFTPAINDLGQVLLQTTIWTRSGGYFDFGSLGGNYTAAGAMNNLGQVVGASTTNNQSGQTHAFVWTSTGGIVDLNTVTLAAGTTLDMAFAISDNGLILARGNSSDGQTYIYLLVPYSSGSTSSQSESFLQRSPFQRPAPGMFVFP